jgi:hypothetical protein
MLEFNDYGKFKKWAQDKSTYSLASNEHFESIQVRIESQFPPECVIAFSYDSGSLSQKMAQELALKALFEVYSAKNRGKKMLDSAFSVEPE